MVSDGQEQLIYISQKYQKVIQIGGKTKRGGKSYKIKFVERSDANIYTNNSNVWRLNIKDGFEVATGTLINNGGNIMFSFKSWAKATSSRRDTWAHQAFQCSLCLFDPSHF